jgi:hypothetical protein
MVVARGPDPKHMKSSSEFLSVSAEGAAVVCVSGVVLRSVGGAWFVVCPALAGALERVSWRRNTA